MLERLFTPLKEDGYQCFIATTSAYQTANGATWDDETCISLEMSPLRTCLKRLELTEWHASVTECNQLILESIHYKNVWGRIKELPSMEESAETEHKLNRKLIKLAYKCVSISIHLFNTNMTSSRDHRCIESGLQGSGNAMWQNL